MTDVKRHLNFYKVSEKMPAHDQEVWVIKNSKFYSSHEFIYAKVEHTWIEHDENGRTTGSSIIYEPGDKQPWNCTLECNLDPEWLWCSVEDVWEILGVDE